MCRNSCQQMAVKPTPCVGIPAIVGVLRGYGDDRRRHRRGGCVAGVLCAVGRRRRPVRARAVSPIRDRPGAVHPSPRSPIGDGSASRDRARRCHESHVPSLRGTVGAVGRTEPRQRVHARRDRPDGHVPRDRKCRAVCEPRCFRSSTATCTSAVTACSPSARWPTSRLRPTARSSSGSHPNPGRATGSSRTRTRGFCSYGNTSATGSTTVLRRSPSSVTMRPGLRRTLRPRPTSRARSNAPRPGSRTRSTIGART